MVRGCVHSSDSINTPTITWSRSSRPSLRSLTPWLDRLNGSFCWFRRRVGLRFEVRSCSLHAYLECMSAWLVAVSWSVDIFGGWAVDP